MKNTMMKTFGSLTAKIAAFLLAFGLGSTAWGAITGTGTSANPFKIATLADLQEFREAVNGGTTYAGQYVKLTADIDLNNVTWTPIGTAAHPFSGVFDGDNKTISNFTLSGAGAGTPIALFGYIKGTGSSSFNNNTALSSFYDANYTVTLPSETVFGCEVKNLNVSGVTANTTADGWTAAAVAYCDNATVKNVHVSDSTITANGKVGGVVAFVPDNAAALIIGCSTASDVTVTASTGNHAAGILARVNGTSSRVIISGCENNATISCAGVNGSGITGQAKYTLIHDCTNNGNVTGSTRTGGIATDTNQSVIIGCTNNGAITSEDAASAASNSTAGILAYCENVNDVIVNCANSGSVTANCTNYAIVSGIVGGGAVSTTVIQGCSNTGTLTNNGDGKVYDVSILSGVETSVAPADLAALNAELATLNKNVKVTSNLMLPENACTIVPTAQEIVTFDNSPSYLTIDLDSVTTSSLKVNVSNTNIKIVGNTAKAGLTLSIIGTGNTITYDSGNSLNLKQLYVQDGSGTSTVNVNANLQYLTLAGTGTLNATVAAGATLGKLGFADTGTYTVVNNGTISHTQTSAGSDHTVSTIRASNITIDNYGTIEAKKDASDGCSYALLFYNGSTVVINCYGGSLISCEKSSFLLACGSANSVTFNVQEGASFQNGTSTAAPTSHGNVIVKAMANPVAKIGDTEYESLAAALADVTKDTPLTWVKESVWPSSTPVYVKETDQFYSTIDDGEKVGSYFAVSGYAAGAQQLTVYCRPGATITPQSDHWPLNTSITIYGNNASLASGREPDLGSYFDMTAPRTINIYNLEHAGIWGYVDYGAVITINVENCANVHEVLVQSGNASSAVTTTVANCSFDYNNGGDITGISQDCGGSVTVTNCTFANLLCGINIKNDTGDLDITIVDCTFTDCGLTSNLKNSGVNTDLGAAIRIGSKEGATSDVTISGATFAYTDASPSKVLDADIVIGDNRTAKDGAGIVTYDVSQTSGDLKVVEAHAKNETPSVTPTALVAANDYTGNNAPQPPVVTFQMTDSVGKIVIQGLDDNVHQNVFDTWNDGVNNRPNIRIAFTQTVEPGGTATKPTNTPYYDYNITQPNNGDPKTFTNADSHAYTFDGWATADGELYDFTTPVASDLVLHPRFSATGATIVIHNEEELRKFAREVELGRKFREQWGEGKQTVKLADDITLNSNWTPVAGFEGIFDGDSHSISGLVINSTEKNVGFFSGLNSHTVVKDLTFVSPTVTSTDEYVGVLAGSASANASSTQPQVSNVNVTGTISVSGRNNVGGLVGQVNANVMIEDCSVNGTGASTIEATEGKPDNPSGRPVGGLIGNTIGGVTVSDCSVSGVTVSGARKLGGLIGQVETNSGSAEFSCTGVSVNNVTINSIANTSFAKELTMGGLVGEFAAIQGANTFSGTVSNVTMTGPANITEGKPYIMGWVSGGTSAAVADAETAMTGANMTFTVTVGGTNTRTIPNDSTYAGINGNPPYVAEIDGQGYLTFAAAIDAAETYAAAHNGVYPTITVLNGATEQENTRWSIVDGYLVRNYFYQDASDANLWHIENLEGLKAFRDSINSDKVSYANKTIKIDADIDLTNDGYWESIKAYPGSYLSGATIDGDGHTITGMAIVTPDPATGYSYGGGFIDKTAGALTVTNLKFINATVTAPSGSQVGVVIGMTYGNVTLNNVDLENCTVTGITKTGAFVGQNDDGTVALRNCDLVNTKVYANYSSALMIGLLNTNSNGSQFNNCTADGNSEFIWMADADNFETKGDVVINGRTYSVSGNSLWLTDPGTDCWSEQRIGNATYTYDGVSYSLKGSVFYPNYVASITRGGVTTKYTSAQEALDLVQNGDTLTLYAGDHGTLYIRQSKTNSLIVDVTHQDGEYGPNDLYRALANVTIKGQEGARVNQIIFETSYFEAGASSWGADWNRIIDSLMEIDNLKIEGVTFDLDKNTAAIKLGDKIRVTGLTVKDCTVNGTGNYGNSERLLYNTLASKEYKSENRPLVANKIEKDDVDFTSGLKNLTITGCTFNNLYQVAELRNVENLTFTNNTISNTASHALLSVSDTQNNPFSLKGIVTVSGNTATSVGDRFFRTDKMTDATVTLVNNTIISSGKQSRETGNDARIVAMDNGSSITYTVSGNSWNGQSDAAVLRNTALFRATPAVPIYVAQIGSDTYETFAEAIQAAEEYAAAHGNTYPTITVLDDTDEIGNVDWKIVDGKLVKKVYVAQVLRNDAVVGNAETLAEAILAAQNGDTIELVADSTENFSYTEWANLRNKSLALTGNHTLTSTSEWYGYYFGDYDSGNRPETDQLAISNVTFAKNGGNYTLLFDGVAASLNGVTVNGAANTALSYANGATGVLENVTVANTGSHSAAWRNAAIALQGIGAGPSQVIVKSGTYTSENGYAAYIFSSGGILTIEGGDFVGKFCANIDRNTYHNDYNQSWIYITGGNFKNVAFETSGNTDYCGYVITGGLFDADPSAYVADGYAAVALTEGEEYDAGYRYAVGKVVASDLVPAAGATETEATYNFSVVVTNETGEIGTLATDQTVTVRVDDEHSIADVTLNDFDISDVLASAVSAVDTGNENVTVDLRVSSAAVSGGKVTFEAHPEAVIKVGSAAPEVVTLTNDDLADGATFSLKFYVTGESFAVGTLVKITHKSADYEDEVFIASVAEDTAGRYVPVTVSHFSTFEIEPFTPDAGMVAVNSNTGVQYESLAAAIAEVPTDGTATTIIMLADVTIEGNVGLTIATGKNIVLDLNGKTVKQSVPNKAASAFIVNNGTLTIQDTSANHDGVLIAEGSNVGSESYSYGNYTIDNNGTLNIVSGTVESKMGNNAWYCACYAVNNAGALAISGGLVKGDGSAVRLWCDSTADATSLTMTGGEINGFWGVYVQNPSGSAGNNKGALSVTGGTITATRDCLFVDSLTDWTSGLDAEFSDGTFNAGRSAIRLGENYALSGISISGGTYTTGTGSGYADVAPVSAADDSNSALGIVSGGTFSKAVPEEYCATGYIPTALDPVTGKYTVKVGTYVAQVISANGATTNKYDNFKTALDAAPSGSTVQLLTNITATASSLYSDNRIPISKSLTIDGQNYTITVANRGFGVGVGAESNIDVTFKDVIIKNTSSGARCIDTRGHISSLTLDHATLDTQGCTGGYNQPLTIGGSQADPATVTIKNNSLIQTNDEATKYYAIITFNPVNMTITNSTVKGWACIYAKGPDGSTGSRGSVFTVVDSTLESSNIYNGNSNAFAAIMIADNDVEVNIDHTAINIYGNSDQKQAIAGYTSGNSFSESSVSLGDGNTVTLGGSNPNQSVIAFNTAGSSSDATQGRTVVSGGSFNKPVDESYCADGYIPQSTTTTDPVTGDPVTVYGVKEGYYVAQIGTGSTADKFESLADAIAAVQDNETIQLLTNITLTAGVEVVKDQGGTFVLDGAGYTITAASPLSNSKIIAVYIEGKASDASAMQLHVKNLTIVSDGLKYGFVLDSMQVAMSNVVVRANGGTAFCANTHASVTIDDCTIANTGSHTESWRDTALAVSYMADVTVNSGTFTSENGWAAYIFTSGGTIDVKGGTFSGKVRSSADTVGENRGDATITISGGEFSNVELTTAHDSNLNATIAVSGGWFSAQVPAMACAEGFEPTGALADAPNAAVPYTVGYAADIIYPIEGTDGVPIALAWATNNTSVVSEGAPVTAADVPNIITALRENGANNMPKWESYVLGLNPADPTAVLRLTATAKNATTVTVTGSIDTTKFPSISNMTVTFRLAARNDDGTWTDIVTGKATPSFDVALDDVAGKVLAIFADIVTE